MAELAQQAHVETDERKLEILDEALGLGRADATIQPALAEVRRRRKQSARRNVAGGAAQKYPR